MTTTHELPYGSTKRAAALVGQVTPTGAAAATRWELAQELICDIRDLDRRIAAVTSASRLR